MSVKKKLFFQISKSLTIQFQEKNPTNNCTKFFYARLFILLYYKKVQKLAFSWYNASFGEPEPLFQNPKFTTSVFQFKLGFVF